MQIAYWKTRDGKHWLRLYEIQEIGENPRYYCVHNTVESPLMDGPLESIIKRIVNHILPCWPSKGIRQH